jgi:CRISPR system Cascade subunit CasC
MNALLELHILQNFAPSNLNRDDTGSPKDAIFGGYRRARISSQSLKRAMRLYVREQQLLEPKHLGERTQLLVEAVSSRLSAMGRDPTLAQTVVQVGIQGLGLKLEDGKAQYLIFLGASELDRIASIINEHWDSLSSVVSDSGEGKKAKDAKKAAKDAVPDEVKKALSKAMHSRGDGGDAVDVALFGRMLADLPSKNQDAACQVAHAISTNKVEREFDFFTAVDDLKNQNDEADAGAGMLGTVEFNSACYYRYLVIDLEQLRNNLQGDTELVKKGLEAFLKAAVLSAPSGKQNTFAAHNPPSFIALSARANATPRNLANAFEQPAKPGYDETNKKPLNLTQASAKQLEAHWQQLEAFYGQGGDTVQWNGTNTDVTIGEPAGSLEALIQAAVGHAMHKLGV